MEVVDEYLYYGEDPFWSKNSDRVAQMTLRRIDCTIKLIKKHNTQQADVLDLACGEGVVTNEIYKYFPEYRVFGLDISFTAVKKASEVDGVQYCVADVFKTPFASDSFDTVVCNNFWEHITNPIELLNEVKRVLRDDGVFILSTPNRYHFHNIWALVRGRPMSMLNTKYHVTEYTVGQMKEMLRFGGFRVTDIISSPIKLKNQTLKTRIVTKTFKPLLKSCLSSRKSDRLLEDTMFIAAKKEGDCDGC